MTILAWICAAAAAFLLSRIGLHSCEASVPSSGLAGVVAAGAACAPLSGMAGYGFDGALIFGVLGACLAAAAFVDRETAWAPDALVVPLAALCPVAGILLGGWGWPLWIGAIAGLAVWAFVMGVWVTLAYRRSEAAHFPPGDLVCALLPFALLGFSLSVAILQIVLCGVAIGAKRSAHVRKMFCSSSAGMSAAHDMDVDASSYVPFLAMILPLTLAALGLSLIGEIVL